MEMNKDQENTFHNLAILNQNYFEIQLGYAKERFLNLALEINKTSDECISYFLEANDEFNETNFTAQFLIGYVLLRLEDISDELDLSNLNQVLEAIFQLGYVYGIASTLISNNVNKEAQFKQFKSELAKNAVKAKLEKDPKQKALKKIMLDYESQKTQFKRRGFSAQFVKEMANKYPEIESYKTIETLVAKLNKSNDHISR